MKMGKNEYFFERLLAKFRFQNAIKHIPQNSIVCDIGCGRDFRFLKQISGFIRHGIGIDKNAKNFKNSQLEIKRFDVENGIPLNPQSVDIITMLAVLEHLRTPEKVLKECFRVLKRDGKLILTTPSPRAKPVLEFLSFKLNLLNQEQIKNHKNYFAPAKTKKMLQKAGFSQGNIKSWYFGFGFNNLTIAKK